jgi:hypothetical protein
MIMRLHMTTDIDTIASKIAENSFGLALSGRPWNAIGLGIRPSHGLFWRLTAPRWKRDLDQRIQREVLVIITSAHIVAFPSLRDALQRRLVDLYWGDDGRLISRYFSKLALSAAITEYVEMPSGEWSTPFVNHLGLSAIPDREMRTRMLGKGVHFAIDVTNIIPAIRSRGLDMASWGPDYRIE